MSGWFRVTVVNKKNETVRVADFEVPEHPHPIAIGSEATPYPPEAVEVAAGKLLKRGEQVGAIVHITPDWMQVDQPMTAKQIEAQIARLQKQLEETA